MRIEGECTVCDDRHRFVRLDVALRGRETIDEAVAREAVRVGGAYIEGRLYCPGHVPGRESAMITVSDQWQPVGDGAYEIRTVWQPVANTVRPTLAVRRAQKEED